MWRWARVFDPSPHICGTWRRPPTAHYLITSFGNGRYLSTSTAKASDFTRLQDYAKDDPKQRWNLRHGLYGDTSDDYAIIPELYPGYALSLLGNSALNNVYVVPVRMWGDSPSLPSRLVSGGGSGGIRTPGWLPTSRFQVMHAPVQSPPRMR
jgi:hypothetical protein